LGFRAHPLPGAQRTAIGITGNQGEVDRGNLEELSGVAEVIRVSKAYKLASRDVRKKTPSSDSPATEPTPCLHRRKRSGHHRRALAPLKATTSLSPSPN